MQARLLEVANSTPFKVRAARYRQGADPLIRTEKAVVRVKDSRLTVTRSDVKVEVDLTTVKEWRDDFAFIENIAVAVGDETFGCDAMVSCEDKLNIRLDSHECPYFYIHLST
jgi:uncharacterized linocin/CFP29 family protein